MDSRKTNFEKLRIYELAETISDQIWEIAISWDSFARDTVGKQVVRSADSIGANIAEGVGRWGLQDQKRFIYIARESLNETKHWLRRAFKRKLLPSEQVESLKPVLEEIAPKLNAYANSLGRAKNHKQPSTIHDHPSNI
jgi:four helix bundle protein